MSLERALELPPTPIANEFLNARVTEQEKFPLGLVLCQSCGHLQSSILIAPLRLFGNYVYTSSTSPSTIQHLRDEARTIAATLGLRQKEEPFIVEIGSNDGALLREFAAIGIDKSFLLGVEPAGEVAGKEFNVIPEFFTEELAHRMKENYIEPNVVIANNVFAHVPNVENCLRGVKALVGDGGVLVMEVAHAADLLTGAWDTIYHEHLSHHALSPLMSALDAVDLPVFDVEMSPSQVGRGSMRVWAGSSRVKTAATSVKIAAIIESEKRPNLTSRETWTALEERIREEGIEIRKNLRLFSEKKIWGYGAPAKMTTLMYGFSIEDLPWRGIADDSSWKQGKFAPGTGIPIRSLEDMLEDAPDLIVIFAWNFARELRTKIEERGFVGQTATPQELIRGEVRT
jgi:SAM-dependent methyltransferase